MQISSVSSLQGISLLRNSLKSTVPEIEKHHLTRKCSYGKQVLIALHASRTQGKPVNNIPGGLKAETSVRGGLLG